MHRVSATMPAGRSAHRGGDGRPLLLIHPAFATWRMLDDVGHLPMLDDPALVAALIRDVVRQATR